jgi:hypothetical protein
MRDRLTASGASALVLCRSARHDDDATVPALLQGRLMSGTLIAGAIVLGVVVMVSMAVAVAVRPDDHRRPRDTDSP